MANVFKCDVCGREIPRIVGSHWLHIDRVDFEEFGDSHSGIDICNSCRSDVAEYHDFLNKGGLVTNELQHEQNITERVLRYILEGYIV